MEFPSPEGFKSCVDVPLGYKGYGGLGLAGGSVGLNVPRGL